MLRHAAACLQTPMCSSKQMVLRHAAAAHAWIEPPFSMFSPCLAHQTFLRLCPSTAPKCARQGAHGMLSVAALHSCRCPFAPPNTCSLQWLPHTATPSLFPQVRDRSSIPQGDPIEHAQCNMAIHTGSWTIPRVSQQCADQTSSLHLPPSLISVKTVPKLLKSFQGMLLTKKRPLQLP